MANHLQPGYQLFSGAEINAASLPVVVSVTTTATTVLPTNADVIDVHVTQDSTLLMGNGYDGQIMSVRFFVIAEQSYTLTPPTNWGSNGNFTRGTPYSPQWPSPEVYDWLVLVFCAPLQLWFVQTMYTCTV